MLADRLDVSPRTVRGDVDRLRELGYEIRAVKGPDGGYRLASGSELPPLLFDDEQAVALAVALQSVPSAGVDPGEAAERALATVRQVMLSRLRHRIDGFRFTGTEAAERVDPVVLAAVSGAVRERRTLRFDYGDGEGEHGDGEEAARRTEPHAIVARRRAGISSRGTSTGTTGASCGPGRVCSRSSSGSTRRSRSSVRSRCGPLRPGWPGGSAPPSGTGR